MRKIGLNIDRFEIAVIDDGTIPIYETNLFGLGLSAADVGDVFGIDARLNYLAENLVAPASVDIRGNENPTAASAVARQTLNNNGIYVDYNQGFIP